MISIRTRYAEINHNGVGSTVLINSFARDAKEQKTYLKPRNHWNRNGNTCPTGEMSTEDEDINFYMVAIIVGHEN